MGSTNGWKNGIFTQRKGAKFWAVVAQIVVLDAIFSLDSVITAVGMVDHAAAVMITAVIIAVAITNQQSP